MMRPKRSPAVVRHERESCDVENPNHFDSGEPTHTRSKLADMCKKSCISSAIVIGLLLIVWYTAPEIASWKTSGFSGLRLNRKNGEADNQADPEGCKVINTDGNMEDSLSNPRKEMSDHKTGFWKEYNEKYVPELHEQNNGDHEYNSKTFVDRNSYQTTPGQNRRNKQFPYSPFPDFNNVPQEYYYGYPAYNNYLNHRKDYPVNPDQLQRKSYDGKPVYNEEYLHNSFDILSHPESAWQNSDSKIKSPEYSNYRTTHEKIDASVQKVSNALASFQKQQRLDKLGEGQPLQSQVSQKELGLRKDLSVQPGKIQDQSIKNGDVPLNSQQEQQELQQSHTQQHPEEQHHQKDHENTRQSQIKQEQHALNREANNSPHLSVPHQNEAQIEKIKIITEKDIKTQHSMTDDESSFYNDTIRDKSTNNQKEPRTPNIQVNVAKASVKQPKESLVKLRVQPESLAKNVEDWRLPNLYRNQASQPTADDTVDLETKPRVKKIRASQWGSYEPHAKNKNNDDDLEGFPQALLLGCPESGLGGLHVHSIRSSNPFPSK